MAAHRLHRCSRPGCYVCESTPPKQHCEVCGGQEGSLPSECPGTRLSRERLTDIFRQRTDFKNGEWIELQGEAA